MFEETGLKVGHYVPQISYFELSHLYPSFHTRILLIVGEIFTREKMLGRNLLHLTPHTDKIFDERPAEELVSLLIWNDVNLYLLGRFSSHAFYPSLTKFSLIKNVQAKFVASQDPSIDTCFGK